jgi:hypothetical protein
VKKTRETPNVTAHNTITLDVLDVEDIPPIKVTFVFDQMFHIKTLLISQIIEVVEEKQLISNI